MLQGGTAGATSRNVLVGAILLLAYCAGGAGSCVDDGTARFSSVRAHGGGGVKKPGSARGLLAVWLSCQPALRGGAGGSKKGGGGTKAKVKKIVEDKTFGLKNKKGKAMQKIVKSVEAQARDAVTDKKKAAAAAARKKVHAALNSLALVEGSRVVLHVPRRARSEPGRAGQAKEEAERREAEMNLLFKPVTKAQTQEPEKTAKEQMEDYEYQSSIQD